MAAYPYESLQPGYAALWAKAQFKSDWWKNAGTAVAKRIRAARPQYDPIEAATSVPWWVIGIIHAMEANLNFGCHLHNGDSLNARTWQVPKGRPPKPPADGKRYTFQESAIDALIYQGLDKVKDWGPERVAWVLEMYNGWGYRMRGVPSAYLWSGTDQYSHGKYVADGVWSSTAVSQQLGGMTILRCLDELEDSIDLSPGPKSAPEKSWPTAKDSQIMAAGAFVIPAADGPAGYDPANTAAPDSQEPAPAKRGFKDWITSTAFAEVNALAEEGSRLAQRLRALKQWLWMLIFGPQVVAAAASKSPGNGGMLARFIQEHPLLSVALAMTVTATVVYVGVKLAERFLVTAKKDGRYQTKKEAANGSA